MYVKCLNESGGTQEGCASPDMLLATNARELFLQYLRRSLLEETQAGNTRQLSKEWARTAGALVERKVFGELVTKSVYLAEADGAAEADRAISGNGDARPYRSPLKILIGRYDQEVGPVQLELPPEQSADFGAAIQDALASLGPLPAHLKVGTSSYVVRVLWALELGFQAGLGPVRASDVAMIIRDYGRGGGSRPERGQVLSQAALPR